MTVRKRTCSRRWVAAMTLRSRVVYRRYLPMVLRCCWRETGNRELAADLSAEVFAAALTACRRYRAARGSIAAWLLGIARNKLRESRRRGRVEAAARRRLGVEPTAITDADLERVEELASLDGEILGRVAGLPDDQRKAVLTRIVDERSYEEIASELRCSEMAAAARQPRAEHVAVANRGAIMSDYFDHVERELRTAVRGHAHLPWYVRVRLRHSRALVVVLAGLIIAGPALAAVSLLHSGSSVGPASPKRRTRSTASRCAPASACCRCAPPIPAAGRPGA
ncbi:MAG: sigma-70 family RNA polymerase sigma factor [Solirubrobacteraceae bacterium]